jgi:hypothetical protein
MIETGLDNEDFTPAIRAMSAAKDLTVAKCRNMASALPLNFVGIESGDLSLVNSSLFRACGFPFEQAARKGGIGKPPKELVNRVWFAVFQEAFPALKGCIVANKDWADKK